MRMCGSADVHTCKMRILMRIKIRTLPFGQEFFGTSYFKNLHTLHCYYCRYFNVPTVIAINININVGLPESCSFFTAYTSYIYR